MRIGFAYKAFDRAVGRREEIEDAYKAIQRQSEPALVPSFPGSVLAWLAVRRNAVSTSKVSSLISGKPFSNLCQPHALERTLERVRSFWRRKSLSLAKDSPLPRPLQPVGSILPLPILGGLHHHYVRI
jgi:hypothetical protein